MTASSNISSDLLHWNCNSFYRRDNELNLIVSKYNPWVIALNETRFKPIHKPKLKGYAILTNNPLDPSGSGGVALLIKNCLPYIPVPITTHFQAAACKVDMAGLPITICSIYLSPSITIDLHALTQFVSTLQRPLILVGDFNAHSTLWGSPSEDSRGRVINELINRSSLVCINDGSPTYIHGNGSQTHIDLVLCSPEIAYKWKFSVLDDLYGSDHFPIILTSNTFSADNSRRQRWNEKHADWNLYSELAQITNILLDQPINDIVDQYTAALSQAARSSIPLSSAKPLKRVVPWWSGEIKTSINDRKQKLKLFQRYPTSTNLIEFKRARSRTKRLIRLAKQTTWNEFRAQIGPSINSKELWGKIRAVTGTGMIEQPAYIRTNNNSYTDQESIANVLGTSFTRNSSSNNFAADLIPHKELVENHFSLSRGDGSINLNVSFNLVELKAALKRGKSKAPGENLITNKMLSNLSFPNKQHLLNIFNCIWSTRTFPSQWKKAIVIPIPKNPQSRTPTEFRPISLINNDCKVMERMVNERLIWFLEKNQLLAPEQFGFRANRSCMDAIQILNEAIVEVFKDSSHLTCIFFDIEKAYERVWRLRIVQQLAKWKVEGNILHFVWNYLKDRTFQVMIGNVRSAIFTQENGVTTGSSLAVTLFLAAIDSIRHVFTKSKVKFVLYADDLTVFCGSQCINEQKQEITGVIGKLELWCKETGFSFAASKTKSMHVCRKLKCTPAVFNLNGNPLENVETQKFLGMILDHRLNWKAHVKNTMQTCKKSLNTLKCLKGIHRGSNRATLLQVFQSLVLSKLDYGCEFYGDASKTTLALLDPILNEGVRVATGAFRTSPIISVLAEAGILSLSERRELALLKFFIKQKAKIDSPFHSYPSYFSLNLNSKGTHLANTYNVPTDIVATTLSTQHPLWRNAYLKINTSLQIFSKSTTPIQAYKTEFLKLLSSLPANVHIQYTDGSKSTNGAGFAVTDMVSDPKKIRTTNDWSAMSLEAGAIREAVRIASVHPSSSHAICTDSLSTLEALKSRRIKNTIVREIRDIVLESNKDIVIIWIPGHVGIPGNEAADTAARSAAEKIEIDIPHIIGEDAEKLVHMAIWRAKIDRWASMNPPNHLSEIKNLPVKWTSSNFKLRRESTIICRLRIGHTNITHLYHILRSQQPRCEPCNEPLTVKHFLISCPRYNLQRSKFGIPNTLKRALADDTDILENVLKYLKEIDIYNQI